MFGAKWQVPQARG